VFVRHALESAPCVQVGDADPAGRKIYSVRTL
jgi:hypothetical protein